MSVNFGIIGRGFGYNYIRTIKAEIPDLAEVVGVCSKNIQAGQIITKFITEDYRELCGLCSYNLDCVVIASPASLHYKMVKCALENNKHVICEKPFTLNYIQEL